MSATSRIKETFQREYSGKDPELWKIYKQKLIDWRRAHSVERLEKPTNIVSARSLGYKAKQGFVMARVRIRKGARRKTRPSSRRKPSKMGVLKFTPHKSLQVLAEERCARKFINLEVLNSYWVGQDGQHKFFEVILVDPTHPAIRNDASVNFLLRQPRRVHRGLTSAGKKSRGI